MFNSKKLKIPGEDGGGQIICLHVLEINIENKGVAETSIKVHLILSSGRR